VEDRRLSWAVAACSCSRDHVKVYSVTPRRLYSGAAAGGSELDTSSVLAVETLVGIYCGDKLPGPQMSDERSSEMRVRLTTNERGVEAGFRAKYEFVEKSPRTSAYHTHTHTSHIPHSIHGYSSSQSNLPHRYGNSHSI